MKNSKISPRQLTAKEFAAVMQERNRRKALKEQQALEKQLKNELPELSVEARLMMENRERVLRYAREERRERIREKWNIG
jgi:hypothetical protein